MNIAHRISQVATKFPDKKSVVFSKRVGDHYEYPFYTFKEFETRSNQIAHRLVQSGIRPGMRTLLFVKPCLDFSIITFALFKIGAVPVLIDPGMGMKSLLRSVSHVKPDALVSIGMVHWLRRILRQPFRSVQVKVSLQKVGGSTSWLYQDLEKQDEHFTPLDVTPSDTAAILFTSGGTGIPKGVLYTHGILNAQTDALRDMFDLNENQIDVPGFPLFALFTLAMGMTSVIPDMDPTKPAQCDPAKIVKNILDNGATFVAGSPSIWERVGLYCKENRLQLPTVKQVVMFGAPVRLEIHKMFKDILPSGTTYTPYGATECLPVSLISGEEILSEHIHQMKSGEGTCIGLPVKGTQVKIIKTSHIPESQLNELPPNTPGEVVVHGPQVTPGYFEMPTETEKAKITVDGVLWHRMGDVGYLDDSGRLWFLGRKTHAFEGSDGVMYYPLNIEAIFNQHPQIKRTALIKLERGGRIVPGLAIERHDRQTFMNKEFEQELKTLAESSPYTTAIKEFHLHPGFPVDVRHNIKIDQVKLAAWAQKRR